MSQTLFAVALIVLASHAVAATQYIRFGKLIDGRGKVWTNVAVVVENDRIRGVEPDASPPSGADVIDLRRYTAITGRGGVDPKLCTSRRQIVSGVRAPLPEPPI